MNHGDLAAWTIAIHHYTAWLSVNASHATVRLRAYQLGRLAAHCMPLGPWEVSEELIVDFLICHAWTAETRKSYRAGVVGFYRWAVEHSHIDVDPTTRLPRVSVRPGKPKPTPERVILEAWCRADVRGRMMLALAGTAGLRRAEIARVHSLDLTNNDLRVRGKGDRVRIVPLPVWLADAVRAAGDGWLFPGRIDGHISADAVGKALKRLLGHGWTAHTLRHRFASQAYAATHDLRAVQELLGHSKPETTAIYTAVPDDALRAAANGAAHIGAA